MEYICRKHFQSKEHKHYFIIKVYNDLIDDVVDYWVDEKVYNNYDKYKHNDIIDSANFEKTTYQNRYGCIVSNYKLVK